MGRLREEFISLDRRRGQRQGAESGQGHVLQLLIQGLEVIEEAGWSKDVRRAWAGGKVRKEAEVPPGSLLLLTRVLAGEN